jgi:hypothetical protein
MRPTGARPKAQPLPTGRFTIGVLLVVAAALAGPLVLFQRASIGDHLAAAFVVAVGASLLGLSALIDDFTGKRCPACSRWALRRLALHRSYYRCTACRARFKRAGLGTWLDASGPDDAARYRKRTEAGTWKGYAVPHELAGSTSGVLLQSKRSGDLRVHPGRRPSRLRLARWHQDARKKIRAFLDRFQDVRR